MPYVTWIFLNIAFVVSSTTTQFSTFKFDNAGSETSTSATLSRINSTEKVTFPSSVEINSTVSLNTTNRFSISDPPVSPSEQASCNVEIYCQNVLPTTETTIAAVETANKNATPNGKMAYGPLRTAPTLSTSYMSSRNASPTSGTRATVSVSSSTTMRQTGLPSSTRSTLYTSYMSSGNALPTSGTKTAVQVSTTKGSTGLPSGTTSTLYTSYMSSGNSIQLSGTSAPVKVSSTNKGSPGLPSAITPTLSTSSYTSSWNELHLSDRESKEQPLPIILGVIGGSVIISIVAVVIILYKRRQNNTTEEAVPTNAEDSGVMNQGYESWKEANISFGTVENDIINNESIVTYSQPVKKTKDAGDIVKDEAQYGGDVATDEYDRIEFGRKCAKKQQNYDSLRAMEGEILDDTYVHTASQTNSHDAYSVKNYSRCQFDRKDLTGEDICIKTPVKNENLHGGGYSCVNLDFELNKQWQPNINEEDSYNHINFDKTENLADNRKVTTEKNVIKYQSCNIHR